jgi:hypothetical protein
MEEFKYEGFWWLPEDPSIKISGTLFFDPKTGSRLELIGTFKTYDDLKHINQEALSSSLLIILGLSVEGKAITLYKCFETSFSLSFPGIARSAFLVNIIFIGYHFKREEDILLDEVSINYSNLREWAGISGFTQNTEFDKNDHLKKFSISYEYPSAISSKLEMGSIYLDFHFNLKSDISYAFNFEQMTFFKIVPTAPHNLIWFLDELMDNLRDLLSLAIGRASYPIIIIGKSKACYTKQANGEIVLDDILIYHSLGSFSGSSMPVSPHDMLFTFNDISVNFESIMNNWIIKAAVLQPVYDLYFGTLYNPSLHLNYQFLSLAQAIESYHRRIFSGKYVSDDAYKSQKDAFICAILPDTEQSFKNSLCNKIKYMNEFSLSKRLKLIITKFSELMSSIINSPDIFVRDVKNTRNYLTHYDERLETEAKKGQDLYWLVQKMRALVEICLLSELGIEDKTIKILFTRNQRNLRLLSH